MGTTSIKQIHFQLSTKNKEIIFDTVVYLFIVLFMYTAASKLLTVKSFASTLAKSPLIGSYSLFVAWAIPIIEIAISMALIFPTIRKTGLWASLILMLAFTTYLMYMVFSGSELPCHCGGVISRMTWQQHIWFNLGFVALGIIGINTNKK
ncbi:MauE/DoxX family redox-associated membrane protein [Pedobacter frigoris]|uniref:MauE/DoxX family redox-associated membrane protein n=1 Tax=Pedobacter frigoris TaxID=2571272 RepID=UPI00292D3C66|nr:MauE/DoxX family redox-associated membrane protein [Pedobacter frigoris]